MKIGFDLVIELYIKMPVERMSHKPDDKHGNGYSKQVVSKSQNPPGRKAKPRYGDNKKVLHLQQPGTFQSLPPNLSLQTPNAVPSSIHQINFCGDTGNGTHHMMNHPLGGITGISPKAATTVKHSQNPGPNNGNFLATSDNQSPSNARGSKRNGFFTAQQNSQSPNKKPHQQQTLTIPSRQLVGSQFKRSKQLVVKTIKRDQERIEAVSNNNGQYTTLSSADNDVKSVSQDPIGIRVQGKRQLAFGSKKVVNVHSSEAPRKDNLASGGVLLQDNHRRRLQALAQAQHNQFASSNTNSDGSQEPFLHGTNQANGSGNSSNMRNFKVINKKLITFSSSKKTGRHGANFASQTSTIIKDMPPVQHNSVMARFETNSNDIKKVNNIQASSALNSHRNTVKADGGQIPQSVKNGQRVKDQGNLNIRQEKSPMQPSGTSQPATSRKFTQIQGSLGYRRHQIIQDITDEASPSTSLTKRPSQKHLTHQTSDSSIKSFKQITQSLAHMKVKQPDLANMFYKKSNEKSSDGSSLRNSKTSLPTATNMNTSQNQQSSQFNFTKKAMLLSNVDSASTSRERTIRLKKQPQHSQLQNTSRFKDRVTDGSKIASQFQSASTAGNQNGLIPQVGKRRPLIIRKNNFVQKEQDLNSDLNSRDARGMDMVIRANDSNEVSLDGVTSVERKLNNTQKIHMKGDATIGSDQSLSMTRNNPFGNTGTFNTNTNNSLLDGTFRTPHAHQTDIRAGLNEMVVNRKASQSGIEQSNQNQLNSSRLFKVNKSKKKLDTARRSRIKELAEMGDVPSQQVVFAQLQGLGPSTTMSQAHGRGIPQLIKNASQENSLASTAIVNLSKESSALLKSQVPAKQLGGTVYVKQSTRNSKMSKTMKSKEELNPQVNALGDSDKEHTQPDEQRLQKDPSAQPGIRPVRLFNYATTANLKPEPSQNQSHAGMPQTGPIVANRAIAAGETDGTVTSRVGGQKTPTSSKSQKPLRRGQIFRKQNEKSKHDGSSATSKERAELTAREGTTEKLTVHSNSMTDPSAISSSKQLPLKDNRRSNHLLN